MIFFASILELFFFFYFLNWQLQWQRIHVITLLSHEILLNMAKIYISVFKKLINLDLLKRKLLVILLRWMTCLLKLTKPPTQNVKYKGTHHGVWTIPGLYTEFQELQCSFINLLGNSLNVLKSLNKKICIVVLDY